METQTSIVTGVDFVTLPTKDAEKARKFYEDTLGLSFLKQWGSLPAYEFNTDNLTIAVMESEAFGRKFEPHAFPLEFQVEDFHAAKSELESRGIEFVGDPIDSGVCHQAFFKDPDGNMLAIHERYAEGVPPAAG
jgi:catechol 2,3-dioxygenase-like lactoylglutathione lyase family enzyme